MLIPAKFQIDKRDYEFIKQACKSLHYKSLSAYMRDAVNIKVTENRKITPVKGDN